MRNDAASEFEGGVGGIVRIGLVAVTVLIDPLGNMGGSKAAHRLHLTEQVVQDVAPVTEHVENDSAAIGLAVVPARALRGLPVSLEHPIAELAPNREDTAEEAGVP